MPILLGFIYAHAYSPPGDIAHVKERLGSVLKPFIGRINKISELVQVTAKLNAVIKSTKAKPKLVGIKRQLVSVT